jgi:hypothetical protein
MTESIFDQLEDDWRHVTSHFRHASPTIAGNQPRPHQEPAMALADTSNSLKDTSGSIRAGLQDGLAKLHDVLDSHMTLLDAAIGDVAAVAQIADHPAMQAMEKALPVVPAAVLEGITAMLSAVVAEHAKRAAEVPAAPEQAAEPQQPEEQAA